MRSIRDAVGQDLCWRESFYRSYSLLHGEDVLATLTFQKLTGSLAHAETSEMRLSFEQQGVWRSHITIQRTDSGAGSELATFEPNVLNRDGVLMSAHAPLCRWVHVGSGHPQWDWLEHSERPLVRFSHVMTLPNMKLAAHVKIEPLAATLTELPILVTLGWYLLVLYEKGCMRPLAEHQRPAQNRRSSLR